MLHEWQKLFAPDKIRILDYCINIYIYTHSSCSAFRIAGILVAEGGLGRIGWATVNEIYTSINSREPQYLPSQAFKPWL